MVISAMEAYNLLLAESIIVLDASTEQGPLPPTCAPIFFPLPPSALHFDSEDDRKPETETMNSDNKKENGKGKVNVKQMASQLAEKGALSEEEMKIFVEAVRDAKLACIDNYGPERRSIVLLFEDSEFPSELGSLGNLVAKILMDPAMNPRKVDKVFRTSKKYFYLRYPFLRSRNEMPMLPYEILPNLFLGGEITVSEDSLSLLDITHVVTCMEKEFRLPKKTKPISVSSNGLNTETAEADNALEEEVKWIQCKFIDDDKVKLAPALEKALPFIEEALGSPYPSNLFDEKSIRGVGGEEKEKKGGGRVLIHCEHGVSRSVSVLCAYLMKNYHPMSTSPSSFYSPNTKVKMLSAEEALEIVTKQRREARPNAGFMGQLRALKF